MSVGTSSLARTWRTVLGLRALQSFADGTIGHVGQGWWDEKDDYDYANDRSTGGVTSHYTQMASSNIYAMGCAAQKCNSPGPYGCRASGGGSGASTESVAGLLGWDEAVRAGFGWS